MNKELQVAYPSSSAPRILIVLVVFLLCLMLSACGMTSGAGTGAGGAAALIGALKPLAKQCRGPINDYTAIDLSGSARGSGDLNAERLAAVRDDANRVAACTGYIKVVAFSGAQTDTVVLGSQDFPSTSGTQNARLIKAGHAVEQFMSQIQRSLSVAGRKVTARGTDPLPQLTLASEFQRARGAGRLRVDLLTDGIATAGAVIMRSRSFTPAAAVTAAKAVDVPMLAGADVRIAGLGRVVGPQPTTAFTTAVTKFYGVTCARTRARCFVSSDYTSEA